MGHRLVQWSLIKRTGFRKAGVRTRNNENVTSFGKMTSECQKPLKWNYSTVVFTYSVLSL